MDCCGTLAEVGEDVGGVVRYELRGRNLFKCEGGRRRRVRRLSWRPLEGWGGLVEDRGGSSEAISVLNLATLEHLAFKAHVRLEGMPETRPIRKAYRVCRAHPGATGPGVEWRHADSSLDRLKAAPWGSVVYGTPFAGMWLKVHGYFLPLLLHGNPVASPEGPPLAERFSDLVTGAGCIIEEAEHRGITVDQLKMVAKYIDNHCEPENWHDLGPWSFNHGRRLEPTTVNLHHAVHWVVMPATQVRGCSHVELVADGPQVPVWFASHYWGQPVRDFVACVDAHSQSRQLQEDGAYWVCAYASCQWDLGDEADPSESAFRRSMSVSHGILLVIDQKAMIFNRVWCNYEIAVSLMENTMRTYPFDTATIDPTEGIPVVVADGLTAQDELEGSRPEWRYRCGPYGHKDARERRFPVAMIARGLQTKLEECQVTEALDRKRILNSLAGVDDLDASPAETHARYDWTNDAVRWRIGMVMFQICSDATEVESYGLRQLQEPQGCDVLGLYSRMAEAFQAQDRYDLALEFLSKALTVELATLGEQHSRVCTTYETMAAVQRKRVQPDKALELYANALAIKKSNLSEGHPDVADTFVDMALVHEDKGELASALELYTRALNIQKAALGENCAPVGSCYHSMAVVLRKQGEPQKALEVFEKALSTRQAVLGEEHADVGATYSGMAAAHEKLGDTAKALELYVKSLGIRRNALGDEHPHVGTTYQNVAVLKEEQNYYMEAFELYNQALASRIASYGKTHPTIACLYNHMARVHRKRGDLERALDYYNKALTVHRAVHHGDAHPDVGDTHYNIALAFHKMGDLAKAHTNYRWAYHSYWHCYGKSHPETGDAKKLMEFMAKHAPPI